MDRHRRDPNLSTYFGLVEAFAFFNERLFAGRLPYCMITLDQGLRSKGHYSKKRFVERQPNSSGGEKGIADQIALNPIHFVSRTTEEILSYLVREMVLMDQIYNGMPSRTGYYNRDWANRMRSVGLIPAAVGGPDGLGNRETGQRVEHSIDPGGPFALACAALIDKLGFVLPYEGLHEDTGAEQEAQERSRASKTKYTCVNFLANAWAKPDTPLICGVCLEPMLVASARRVRP